MTISNSTNLPLDFSLDWLLKVLSLGYKDEVCHLLGAYSMCYEDISKDAECLTSSPQDLCIADQCFRCVRRADAGPCLDRREERGEGGDDERNDGDHVAILARHFAHVADGPTPGAHPPGRSFGSLPSHHVSPHTVQVPTSGRCAQ